ncbi:hypothetical protein D3C87_1848060 [compost metagenome]
MLDAAAIAVVDRIVCFEFCTDRLQVGQAGLQLLWILFYERRGRRRLGLFRFACLILLAVRFCFSLSGLFLCWLLR